MSSSSPKPRSHACSYDGCGKSFPSPVALRRHKSENHSTPDVVFVETGIVVGTTRHRSENGDFVLDCPVPNCSRMFVTRKGFQGHLTAQHKGVHTVPTPAGSTGTSKRPRGSSISVLDEPSSNKRGKTEHLPPPAPGLGFDGTSHRALICHLSSQVSL
jgi:hypothetical protein